MPRRGGPDRVWVVPAGLVAMALAWLCENGGIGTTPASAFPPPGGTAMRRCPPWVTVALIVGGAALVAWALVG
ncbi:MAG: hypothetical protein ACRD2F_02055 [Terriglobales bacterium]